MIRQAIRSDYLKIKEWDEFIGDRRLELQRGELYVSDIDDVCLGYIRLTRSEFLNYPLISTLCVNPKHRREGHAKKLIEYVLQLTRGLRIFCTTEVDNVIMIDLLTSLDFREAGYIDFLNSTGIRELVFISNNFEEGLNDGG